MHETRVIGNQGEVQSEVMHDVHVHEWIGVSTTSGRRPGNLLRSRIFFRIANVWGQGEWVIEVWSRLLKYQFDVRIVICISGRIAIVLGNQLHGRYEYSCIGFEK